MKTPPTVCVPADIRRARREWRIHQAYAWAVFGIQLLVCAAILALGLRFLKAQLLLSALASVTLLQIGIFLFSEHLVCILTDSRLAEGERAARLTASLARLLPKSGLRRAPRVYVSETGAPNAFAFGMGVFGSYAVAVTDPLLTLLTDDELDAVLAHELGHLRGRDVATMTLMSVTITLMNRVLAYLRSVGNVGMIFVLLIEALAYAPRIVASAISQLRELAADAYAVSIVGSATPLITAFGKLEAAAASGDKKERSREPLGDLLLSHPDMSVRKAFLTDLNQKEQRT